SSPPVIPIELITCIGSPTVDSILSTGGVITPAGCGSEVEYYGMQYRAIGTVGEFSDLILSPTALTFTSAGETQYITICSTPSNIYTITKGSTVSGWTMTEAPESPAPLGVLHGITAAANLGS